MSGFFKRLGKLPLILFWLGIEYLAVSFNFFEWIFLADIVSVNSEWLRWTRYTGYLGASLWMLIVILLLYLAVSRRDRRWQFAAFLVIVIVGPILYSYTLNTEPVTRMEMQQAYAISLDPVKSPYAENGEWVARSAAWISVLVLLSAFIKELIRK